MQTKTHYAKTTCGGTSLHARVVQREYGKHLVLSPSELQGAVRKRIDDKYRTLVSDLDSFEKALELNNRGQPNWRGIQRAVRDLLTGLLDVSNPEQVFHLSLEQQQQRQMFVSLGGIHLILRLFRPPFLQPDASGMPTDYFNDRNDLWNEILVLLRETCYAVPSLAEHTISDSYLVTFFTMLSHNAVFENTMNLLEEVLAVRSDTFRLDNVPNFYSLVNRFDCRQLAHFCRVLALVLFEPEDRHIMENAAPLKAFELLRLRRDRLTRGGNLVERNQSLVVNTPELLARLVTLLRIMNYGPNLHDLLRNNTAVQTAAMELNAVVTIDHACEWTYFRDLDDLAGAEPAPSNEVDSDPNMDSLLNAFSAPMNNMGGGQVTLETIVSVMGYLGNARLTPQGTVPHSTPAQSSTEARRMLQLHAILLQGHQVELMFVLSTLMCGRRKIAVQQQLADLDIVDVLSDMFHRLSWDAPPYTGPNPLEHIHGPGCECNPESALRVQCVRLIHHYFERDFENNPLKSTMLSLVERDLIGQGSNRQNGYRIRKDDRGLLSQIIDVYLNEPPGSSYRFWLSSVLEAFVRGNGPNEQLFVAKSGVFVNILDRLLAGTHTDQVSNMQSSFDLLGELVKGNLQVLEMLEQYLTDRKLQTFFNRVLDNLVDSSVLLRCIYVTLERYQDKLGARDPVYAVRNFASQGYLTHSWIQFAPTLDPPAPVTEVVPESLFGSMKSALIGLFHNWRLAVGQNRCTDDGGSSCRETKQEDEAEALQSAENLSDSSKDNTAPIISRISDLFSHARINVLHKLMLSVNIQTISHENVCCLNTALTLLISAWTRGTLPQLLAELREHQQNVQQRIPRPCSTSSGRVSPTKHNTGADESRPKVDESVDAFLNFRELLWFWNEYYLRRGRDRLSLEFSSHIPFHVWRKVVEVLTADDGAETSLISCPILLPVSPYVLPTRSAPSVFSCL